MLLHRAASRGWRLAPPPAPLRRRRCRQQALATPPLRSSPSRAVASSPPLAAAVTPQPQTVVNTSVVEEPTSSVSEQRAAAADEATSSGSTGPGVTSNAAAEKNKRWPLILGGLLAAGFLGVGTALQSDAMVRMVQPRPSELGEGEDEDGRPGELRPGTYEVHSGGRLLIAYVLACVPVEQLKVALIQADALEFWSSVLQCIFSDQSWISLASLNELLSGDLAIAAFHREATNYVHVVNGLLAIMRPRDVMGSTCQLSKTESEERLLDVMRLGAILASHPCFLGAVGEERLWEALLQAGMTGMASKPEVALPWSCIAAAAAQRHDLATTMLLQTNVRRCLLKVAAGELPGSDSGVSTRAVLALQSDYAHAALQRLARTAASEGVSDVPLGRKGRRLDEFLEYELSPLPVRPPAPIDVRDVDTPIVSAALCFTGGVFWGIIRGFFRRKTMKVWHCVAVTSAAALAFEGAMQLKAALQQHVRRLYGRQADVTKAGSGRRGALSAVQEPAHGVEEELLFEGLASASVLTALDAVFSCTMLWCLIQPGRAPFALGGWVLGQAASLTQQLPADDEVEAVASNEPPRTQQRRTR